MSKVPHENHSRNTRSKTSPANQITIPTPTPVRPIKSISKRSAKRNPSKASATSTATTTATLSATTAAATALTLTPATGTTPATSAKRKSNSSPTSTDITPSAKKKTTKMTGTPITNDQFQKIFEQYANKLSSDLQLQLNAQTESVKAEIKSQLDAHTAAVQNEIKMQLDTHASSVQGEIKSLGDQLKSEISCQIDDVNNKIDSLQQNVSGQLISVQKNVDSCVERMNTGEDDVRRFAKLNELKIKGIPYKPDENLKLLFQSISQIVGYNIDDPNRVPELFRIQKKNAAVTEPIPLPIIIVKFVAKHIRDDFYSLYLARVKKNPLKTEELQLAQGGRVIISENLTATNQQLFTQAMKMKYEKKLAKVYTKDGLVYVKITSETKPNQIRFLRDLDLVSSTTSSATPLAPPSSSGSTIPTPANTPFIANSLAALTKLAGNNNNNNVIEMQTN